MRKKIIITIIILIIIAAVLFFVMVLPNISKYQADNKPSIVSGVKIEKLKAGSGEIEAKNGDDITVNFLTTLSSGQKVDSSFDRKSLITFKLGSGEIIKGWDIGALGMKVGETRRLTIPPDLAYGAEGSESLGIPKNETLISTIELIKIDN